MRTLADLKLVPVWVNPGHQVASALILLQGHRLKAIGVLENDRLVGVVTQSMLKVAASNVLVAELMEDPQPIFESSMTIAEASERFYHDDLDFALVLDDERYLGLLTPNTLLQEHRYTWDPLTNLGRVDRLREWSVETLRSGQEISLLFLDLNDFGSYNKEHGHVVGDKILRRVSGLLRRSVDPTRDVLVRYGGDEFAIGTTRDRHEAEELAMYLQERAESELVDDFGEPIRFCIGISGGRRSKERANMHYAATFDNLVNAASRACIAAKNEFKKRTAKVSE